MDNPAPTQRANQLPNQRGRRTRPALAIALLVTFAAVAALLLASLRARQAAQERDAIRRLWRLGTCILFEGEEYYANPPFTPDEWAAENNRSWFEDLTGPPPTDVLFARPAPAVKWPEPVVNDNDIPELIAILRTLPTIRQVTLDKNITPAGRDALKKALPNVHYSAPLIIP
jgi:hypothetical protein